MIRIVLAIMLLAGPAVAQTQPNWFLHYVPSPSEWKTLFGSKVDVTNGSLTDPTISGGTINATTLTVGNVPVSTTSGLYMPLSSGGFAQSCSGQPSGTVAMISSIITICP